MPNIKAGSGQSHPSTRAPDYTAQILPVKTGGENLLGEMQKSDTVTGNCNSSEKPLGPAAKHTKERDSQRKEEREGKLGSTSSRHTEQL